MAGHAHMQACWRRRQGQRTCAAASFSASDCDMRMRLVSAAFWACGARPRAAARRDPHGPRRRLCLGDIPANHKPSCGANSLRSAAGRTGRGRARAASGRAGRRGAQQQGRGPRWRGPASRCLATSRPYHLCNLLPRAARHPGWRATVQLGLTEWAVRRVGCRHHARHPERQAAAPH